MAIATREVFFFGDKYPTPSMILSHLIHLLKWIFPQNVLQEKINLRVAVSPTEIKAET